MRGIAVVAAVAVGLVLAAVPAAANDLTDWLGSPGSESVKIAEGFAEFVTGILTDPDGTGLGLIPIGDAQAWYVHISKDTIWRTGLAQLPEIKGAGILGLTIANTDGEKQDLQLVGGVGTSLANALGVELRIGARFATSDLADGTIDLGPLGRVKMQWPAVELAKPI